MGTSVPAAESSGMERLAQEQAALRRVATLVARRAPSAEVFEAVAREVATVLHLENAAVCRYEDGSTLVVLATAGKVPDAASAGSRWPLDGPSVSAEVLRTGRPARMQDFHDLPGAIARHAREHVYTLVAGAPIIVDRHVWGVVLTMSQGPDLPHSEDLEDRLGEFTELVATAIGNSEAHNNLAQIGEEQAALRRVATRVAEGAKPNDVFAAIADEVAAMFGVPIAVLVRYDPNDMATVLATVGPGFSPVGGSFPVERPSVTAAVLRSGKSVRIDDWADIDDPAAALARENGVRWAVGVPIVVDGALWGLIAVAAPDTVGASWQVEERLAKFTELFATAVANSQAHEQLAQLAEEQAALRRVATLVAQGATPTRVFEAVRDEVARMFNVPLTVLMRYDADGMATLLATSERYLGPIGTRWPVEGDSSALARVHESGRPERVDYDAPTHGSIADAARAEGVRSAVGVPVEVDGALWGVMAAASREQPLPHDFERRLGKFTELLATAISNAESRAQLEASRTRIVATADATRQRIERDLHDGAQQQLVSLALELRAARASVPAEFEEHRAELSHVLEGLTGVLDDLREIALGIHPAGLSEGGLVDALGTLARRSLVPVQLDVGFEGRLPETVEVTAYYVVSEALTNTAKYANATVVDVSLAIGDDKLHVTVRDDGCGGADPRGGSGLLGLRDRVEANGGAMRLTSPPGVGTLLNIVLPLGNRT